MQQYDYAHIRSKESMENSVVLPLWFCLLAVLAARLMMIRLGDKVFGVDIHQTQITRCASVLPWVLCGDL